MRKLLIFIFIWLYANIACAEKFYLIRYTVQEDETFAKILKRFVRKESVINANTSMVKKTKLKNPHVKSWKALKKGVKIKLYISPQFLDLAKYKKFEKSVLKRLEKVKKEVKEKKKLERAGLPTGWKGSLFYMASYGQFTQKDPKSANITFLQNSPFSLGGAFSYYPKEKLYSFSMSLYLSHLLASANNLTSESITIPPEIGGNFYGEYRMIKQRFTLYGGLDFEKFSTFNMGGIQQKRKIYVDESTVLYLTLGASKLLSVFGYKIFSKLSFSKSVITNTSFNSLGVTPEGDPYNGFKFLWYLNYKFHRKWFTHTLLKYHWMDGPSELTTLRLGVGIGYILF